LAVFLSLFERSLINAATAFFDNVDDGDLLDSINIRFECFFFSASASVATGMSRCSNRAIPFLATVVT